jgi:putative DNA primase/helicase
MDIVTDSKVNNAAKRYIERGWCVVPLKPGEKDPFTKEWQNLRIKPGEIGEFFKEDSNIGIHSGEPSGGLTDCDFDCPEALAIGPRILPDTLMSGRGNKITHFWYVSADCKSKKYADVDGNVLVEIRSDGHQTAVEPSIHPSGDLYKWINPETDPLAIDKSELKSTVARVAVSTLIARHLPDGGRHDLALAYAGLMLRPLMDLGEDRDATCCIPGAAGGRADDYGRTRLKASSTERT